jgi:hypothetical protein
MSNDREADRSRRKKRRGQQDREKAVRRTSLMKAVIRESKTKEETGRLNLRIGKLIDKSYSIESVAKRLGVTERRVNLALDALRRL